MKKLTHTAILTRAINDCEVSLRDAEEQRDEWERMGRTTEAVFFQDNIVRPLEEELNTLKTLYWVETGAEY